MSKQTEIVTYDADFYHNGHSMQRDRLLIELYGEEWLREQKSKGFYGGDFPEEMLGKPKQGKSGYLDKDGKLVQHGKVVRLESLKDLENAPSNKTR